MQLNLQDLRQQIIRPTLSYLNVCSPVGEELLLATAALESALDPLCHCDGLGIYQIRSEQHRRIWDQYLAFDADLASKVRGLASQHRFLQDPDQELISNLSYATAIAWLIYQCADISLSPDTDPSSLATIWQNCFHDGQAQAEQYKQFCGWLNRFRTAA